MAKRKSTLGRPASPEGRVTLNLTVPQYVAEWLKATGNASGTVKSLVDAVMKMRRRERK